MNDTIAVYPGSFDPVTYGHLDILARAKSLFSRVHLVVLENPRKSALFSVSERVSLIRAALGDDEQVVVDHYSGLTVNYARSVGAVALVRGLRAVSDFENEFQLALMNRRLDPEVNTIFLMTSNQNVFVSSTLIKEVARYGGDIAEFVPPESAKALRERLGGGARP